MRVSNTHCDQDEKLPLVKPTTKKNSSFRAGGNKAYWESRDLLCRGREADPRFKDRESIQNLILRLGYNDFKSTRDYGITYCQC